MSPSATLGAQRSAVITSAGARIRSGRARRLRGDRPFLQEEDALRALEEILRDEPDWTGLFYVEPVELDERDISAN